MQSLTALDTTWLLICSFLVMLMQAGFCLLEAGLVRSKNNINVAFKNLSDFVVTAIVYWLVGFGLMYGSSIYGLFGSSQFMFNQTDSNGAWFLFQLMFCSATATIVGGALAERTSFSSYLVISVLIAGLLYPIPGHWIWGGVGTSLDQGWLAKLGFIDFAGGTAVHLLGGCLALAAVIIVGPRIGRFSDAPDGGSNRINASNYPMATVGVMLLWFGWFGFNTGSVIGYQNNLAQVAINTALGASAGGAALILYFLWRTGKPDIASVLNGTLAGLVGITAGADLYTSADAIIVGAICAGVMQLATHALEKLKIDDVIGAFPVHAAAGLAGTLLLAIFGDSALFPKNHDHFQQFSIQLFGASVVALWSFGLGYSLLSLVNKFYPMRVTAEEEVQGLNFSEHGASTEVQDLLGNMMRQSHNGDFDSDVAVEPHTEVGQIAGEYNKVLDRIRLEIQTREEAYVQLKEASHFQYIFENSIEGIIQLSLEGDVQKANSSAAALLGYASVDRLMTSIGPFMSNLAYAEQTQYEALREDLQQHGQVLNTEIVFNRETDNTLGHASLTIRGINGNKEQAPCLLASIVDVTEQRENQQLKVATKAAEAASQAKSQFLANMSHEIRTPLNGVTGMLELLDRTELEDHQKRYIDIAQNSAKSLLSVINDILDFSKIEAGKMELDNVEFPMRETLADVVDIFASQAAAKNIELIGHIQPDIPEWVIGDPERLRQILINLIGNAIKFTDSGFISLTATCKKRTDNIAVLQLEIEDSGCGISAENIRELFKSFTQADSSTTRKYGGTGLGLTISRQLIRLMKGQINVQSKLGEGSTFTIDLALPLSNHPARAKDQLPASLSGVKVLLVDDHPVNLELTRDLLVPFGLQVDCVDSAAAALEMHAISETQQKPYDLYLLDYHMPDVDGVELADILRTSDTGKDAKIVLLTSIDQVSHNDPKMKSFDVLLVKPVRASRLFDSIMTVMADRIAATAIATTSTLANNAGAANSDKMITLATGKRILLVEDNMVNQIVATEIVEQAGYTVITADNGQEAIDLLASEAFDLILMDCQMPVLDGFEATRRIRELNIESRSGVAMPIVALTANALKGDRDQCMEAGMDDYITKPIDSDALCMLLASYILADEIKLQATGT